MPATTPENTKDWEVFHEVLFFPGRVEDTSAKCISNPSLMYHMYFEWRYNFIKVRNPELLEAIEKLWNKHLNQLKNSGEEKEILDYVNNRPAINPEHLEIIYGWMEQIDTITQY